MHPHLRGNLPRQPDCLAVCLFTLRVCIDACFVSVTGALCGDPENMVGGMDLGGGSTQITFVVTGSPDDNVSKLDKNLYGLVLKTYLYTVCFL